jgi:hypothetical protein
MATIKFILQSKNNPANIYVRLVSGRSFDVKTKTNFVINPDDWSVAKQRPKNLKKEALKNLDAALQNLRNQILECFNKSNGVVDLDWLKNAINPKKENEIPTDLVRYFDFYLKDREGDISDSRKNSFENLKKKVIEFQGKKTIFIENVNDEFRKNFANHLTEKKYRINTISLYVSFVKTICLHAKKKGLKTSLELDDLVIKQEKVASIFFSFNEIEQIQRVNFTKTITIKKNVFTPEKLRNIRDWLVISCYSGQRFSDFIRFSKEMIREQNGVKLIEFVQEKTKKRITLPIHKIILEILELRNGNFPPIESHERYNRAIKTIGKLAGIDEIKTMSLASAGRKKTETTLPKYNFISSHIGRRSFATNFYGKIPTPLLMSATGHASEATFLIYIGKSSAEQAMELSKWF